MALNLTTFFTVIGKHIKHLNIANGYFAALDTAKSDIFTVLNNASIVDLYVPLPGQVDAFQSSVAGWIQTLIADVQRVILDEGFVIDELPIASEDIGTVLQAIHEYMLTETDDIKSSVVSLGGSDVDINKFTLASGIVDTVTFLDGTVFLTRTLDGVNAPNAEAQAYSKYANLEGQMAKTCTIYGKLISGGPGTELIQIFGETDANPSYDDESEKPGIGPVLSNAESQNLISSNYDFSQWSGNNPTNWTVTGGAAGTDWVDGSGTGIGPLKINTAGTYVKKQLVGLERLRGYLCAAVAQALGSTGTAVTKLRVENSDGSTVYKAFTNVTTSDVTVDAYKYIYGFYIPDASVNLDDIYLVCEHDAESNAGTHLDIYKMLVTPATYFNGLGFAFWNPNVAITETLWQAFVGNTYNTTDQPLGVFGTIAVSNSNAGVIQTFFRRAFNVQLPTDDSPTISDSLAT